MLKRNNTKDVFDRLVEDIENPGTAAADADEADVCIDAGEEQVELAIKSTIADEDRGTADEGVDGNDEPGAKHESGEALFTPSRKRRLLRRTAVVAAALIGTAAVGLSGFLGWQLKQRDDTAAAARTAVDVARQYAVVLSSIDTNGIDKNFAQVLDGATGEFKDMYSQSSAQLRQLLIDNKAVAHGNVVDAGIKSSSENKVEVMLFVDQSITNAQNPAPRIDRLRIIMTMEKVENRWLASKVDIL